jgi:GTP cyclohydrolase-4
VEVPEGHKIEAEDLIKIVEESLSSPIYEVLKREDEVEVVLRSHNNPNFVEDVVRKILVKTVEKFKSLPDETMVFARSESIESIHQHNAVAERISFLRELRKETNENLAQKSQRRKNNGGARKPGRSLVLERDHSPR